MLIKAKDMVRVKAKDMVRVKAILLGLRLRI